MASLSKSPPEILLDVGGVGYQTNLPVMTRGTGLPAVGQEVPYYPLCGAKTRSCCMVLMLARRIAVS